MKIRNREAVSEAIVNVLRTPKYRVWSNDIMSEVRLNSEWLLPGEAAVEGGEVYSQRYYNTEHKRDARIMCAILNAEAIMDAIEAVK